MYQIVELLIRNNNFEGFILQNLQQKDEYIVVIFGRVNRYNEVRVVRSDDGSRYGFEARKGNKWVVVVDGRESKEYDWVGYLTFSSDGSHYGFVADGFVAETDGRTVVIDGREGKKYYNIRGLRVSSDGRYAYIVERRDYKYEVIVDGKVIKVCDYLRDIDLDEVLGHK